MANVKLGTKAVGSVLKLNLYGSPKNFIVVHQGKPSSLYDDSCDGTWMLMQDIHSTRQWDGSNNDYKNSDIRSGLNGTFLNLFDANIREAIKQVKIPYHNGTGSSGSVASGANGLSCKIFLLSGYELGWTKSDNSYFPQDGAKLDYFTAGTDLASNKKRIAKYNGSATNWWTRSPNTGDSYGVWYVNSDGGYYNWNCGRTNGARPAFVLPSTLSVSDDGSILTNEPPTAPGSIDVTGVVSGGQATIALTAATDPDGTVESYRYERQVDGGGWQQFADVNSLTQTDQIESDWGTIAYRACAVDDAGAAGPYVTSETETINDSWIIISGPTSDMGSKTAPFDFVFSVSVTGQTATSITATAALDGEQVYSGTPNSGVQVTVPIDTRLLGAGSHTIEVNASKDEYLPASNSYTFTVPAVTIPDGGKGSQAQGQDGRAIFYTTLAQRCIGKDGKDVQAQIDALAARVKTLEG